MKYLLFALLVVGCTKKYNGLSRGDQVEMVNFEEHAEFYKNCKVTFITSQATQHNNVAFVLLKDCDFMKDNDVWENPTVDIFPLENLRKL